MQSWKTFNFSAKAFFLQIRLCALVSSRRVPLWSIKQQKPRRITLRESACLASGPALPVSCTTPSPKTVPTQLVTQNKILLARWQHTVFLIFLLKIYNHESQRLRIAQQVRRSQVYDLISHFFLYKKKSGHGTVSVRVTLYRG